jgi:hypothetical protein
MYEAGQPTDAAGVLRSRCSVETATTFEDMCVSIWGGEKNHVAIVAEMARPDAATDECVRQMYDASLVASQMQTCFVVSLSPAFNAVQIRAVARRFGCGEDDWDKIRRVTRVLVCPCCRAIKNFHLGTADAHRGETEKFARGSGYSKVVHPLPFETNGRLACASTANCRNYRLLSFDVISEEEGALSGGALTVNNTCLTVSPCCGYLVTLRSLSRSAERWSCPKCLLN